MYSTNHYLIKIYIYIYIYVHSGSRRKGGGRDHALIHIYDPIYASRTGGRGRGGGRIPSLRRSVGVVPRGLFRREGGGGEKKEKKEDEGLFHHRRGNRAANYSSFCCLIRVRVSRERRVEKEGKMEGWIRIRGEGFFSFFFFFFYEITIERYCEYFT